MDEINRIVEEARRNGYRLTRRDVLKAAAAGSLGMLLAACGANPPAAAPASAPAASGAKAPTAPAGAAPSGAPTQAAAATKKGGRLVFATKVDTPNLEPHMEISDARMRRSMLMYDTLVEWNDDLTIRPGLAESYETTGTKWVFHLRKGAQFSNGKEVDAEDVVYSLQRVLNSPGKAFYSTIKSAKAADKYTVELELTAVTAPLLTALGGRYAFIIPKDGDKQADLKQTAIGSGPFIVKEFVQNQQLVLQKNPNSWHAKDVSLDELVIRIIPDEANIVAGLRSGGVDLAVFEDSKNYFLTKDDPNLTTTRSPAIRWDILDFPLDTPPFNNVKVRQAISSALDREAIMAAAISGLGTLLGGQPPALWGAMPPEQNPFFKRDVARSKQLLQEAGVATPLKLTLRSIVGYAALNAAAQVIVENLKDVGITAEVQQVDLGIWIDDFTQRKFKDFTMNSWGGFIDPDILYYNHLHKPPEGKDFRRWNNQEISTLLDKGRTTLDKGEREKIYLQVQQMIAEQAPWIPLYSADIIAAQNKKVQNFKQHPSGYYTNLRYAAVQG